MRLAFWIPRSNHLKILAPVARMARSRGHERLALYPLASLRGLKDDIVPGGGMDSLADPFGPAIGIGGEVDAEIHLRDVDWAVAVGLRTAPAIRAYTRASGVKWAALDSSGDNLLYLLEGGKDALAEWDLATTLAEAPRQAAAIASEEDFGRALYELEPIGYPELDQLALPGMTREACRAKWNLPAGGRIVLFAPAARPAQLSRLRRWWWGRRDYPFIARQVRRFCDRHGALLLTKTRAKHRDPAWLVGLSDRYVGETCYYPFDLLELLLASDLVVGGFGSAMAIEAAAIQRPQIWLQAWPPGASEWPAWASVRRKFFFDAGGLWNHAGARTMLCYGPRWREHLRHWADWGAWPILSDFARGQNHHAVTRWAGAVDGKVSERFLDLLEERSGR